MTFLMSISSARRTALLAAALSQSNYLDELKTDNTEVLSRPEVIAKALASPASIAQLFQRGGGAPDVDVAAVVDLVRSAYLYYK